MSLMRYNPDGSLDATFGNGGVVLTDFGGGMNDSAAGIVLRPDGTIVAGGGWANTTGPDFGDYVLARFRPDGSLDPTFGTGGKQVTDVDNSDDARAFLENPDGRLVMFGWFDFPVLAYNADGSPFTQFGTNGVYFEPALDGGFGADATIGPDGKLVVSGIRGADYLTARFQVIPEPGTGIAVIAVLSLARRRRATRAA